MKKIFIVLFLFVSCQIFAHHYYVKNGGSDVASGLSDALAWNTISKVNGFSFAVGDTISFKCGNIWREILNVPRSGNAGNYMIFNSYNTGARPKIYGSNTTTWTAEGHTNIWKSDVSLVDPYTWQAEIWFIGLDNSVTWGDERKTYTSNLSNLVNEYDWTWNGNTVYVYATTDPDTRYIAIEAPQRAGAIYLENYEYITVDSIEMAYTGDSGIGIDYPTGSYTGFKLTNCILHHCGSCYLGTGWLMGAVRNNMFISHNEIYEAGRRNTSIHIYGSENTTIDGIIIEYNILHDGYHSCGVGIVHDGWEDNNTFKNIIIRNNFMYSQINKPAMAYPNEICSIKGNSYEGGGLNPSIQDVQVYNNIFMYSQSRGVWLEGVDTINIYNNTFYDFSQNLPTGNNLSWINIGENCTQIKIKNNIFYNSIDWDYCNNATSIVVGEGFTEVKMDYNLFYQIDTYQGVVQMGYDKYRTAGGSYQMDDIYNDYGYQQHSPTNYTVDPDFINITAPVEWDSLMLAVGSPAIDVGLGVGINLDYNENARDANPDIGAFEYGAAPPDIPPDLPIVETNTTINVIYTRLANGGGNITDDGGGTVSDRGICWSTSVNPSITDSHIHIGSGTGTFGGNLEGLAANTTYHCRSFAKNELEFYVYGADETFTTPVHSVGKVGGKVVKYQGKIGLLH